MLPTAYRPTLTKEKAQCCGVDAWVVVVVVAVISLPPHQ